MWVRRPAQDPLEDWFLLFLVKLATDNSSFPESAIQEYLRFFDSLGNIAFLSRGQKVLFLSHGGIPRPHQDGTKPFTYLKSLLNLTDEKITDTLGHPITSNMYWSDPAEDSANLRLEKRRFKFTEEQFEAFRKRIEFDLMIRGHQVQEDGYKFFFKNRIANIFSSGRIYENKQDINLETAYTRVEPHIIRLTPEGSLHFISLNADS